VRAARSGVLDNELDQPSARRSVEIFARQRVHVGDNSVDGRFS
jgi:hypothetical protein